MLAAFGGAYRWSYPPAFVALAAAAILVRPRIARAGSRTLDLALAALVGCVALQLVPLPLAMRDAVSPRAAVIDQAVTLDAAAVSRRPLSVDPLATRKGAIVAVMVLLCFWVAREAFARDGTRAVVRAVAWTALVISVIAIVTRAVAPRLVYGLWSPGIVTNPYGPFVNRNHMGTWLILALPVPAGYLVARVEAYAASRLRGAALDATSIWLAAAACATFAAIIVSLSRSAVVGTVGAALCGGAIVAARRGRVGAWLTIGGAAVAIAIALAIPMTRDLILRFEDSRTTAEWARMQIWRETVPIVRDFAIAGAGIGAYPTAMLVYQQSDRKFFFNQAHNHYLQLLAEGGLLLLAPLLTAAVAFAAAAAHQVRRDRSPVFWIRTAAVAGIAGALVQSVWETGLRFPANALLFAVLCAIAVHDPPSSRPAE